MDLHIKSWKESVNMRMMSIDDDDDDNDDDDDDDDDVNNYLYQFILMIN